MARMIGWAAALGVAAIGLAPALAAPGRLGGGGALDVSLGRIVSALLFCMLLAVAAAVLIKRGGGRIDVGGWRGLRGVATQRRVQVVETRRISQHADVCLLRCDGYEYLILSSATMQQVLREAPVPGPEALS